MLRFNYTGAHSHYHKHLQKSVCFSFWFQCDAECPECSIIAGTGVQIFQCFLYCPHTSTPLSFTINNAVFERWISIRLWKCLQPQWKEISADSLSSNKEHLLLLQLLFKAGFHKERRFLTQHYCKAATWRTQIQPWIKGWFVPPCISSDDFHEVRPGQLAQFLQIVILWHGQSTQCLGQQTEKDEHIYYPFQATECNGM